VVRTTLDLRFEGTTQDERYALGDLHIDGDRHAHLLVAERLHGAVPDEGRSLSTDRQQPV